MKKLVIFLSFFSSSMLVSQEINWRAGSEYHQHFINVNVGLEYGAQIGLGFGYRLRPEGPLVLNAEVSLPFGERTFDDFKVKIGGQWELLNHQGFSTAVKAYGVFRRYENPNTRLAGYGSELGIVSGYYKSNWFVAGEFGFDKAIATHIKSQGAVKAYYPDINDGWYVPTGGYFQYGLQSGYAFGTHQLTLKLGRLAGEDFKTDPLLPFYVRLGYIKTL